MRPLVAKDAHFVQGGPGPEAPAGDDHLHTVGDRHRSGPFGQPRPDQRVHHGPGRGDGQRRVHARFAQTGKHLQRLQGREGPAMP